MPSGNSNYPRRPWPKYGMFPAGDPRRQILRKSSSNAAVLAIPTVITVGVNAINDTSANVIGSINPNGTQTVWWITYGLTPPLPGTDTTHTLLGSGTDYSTVSTVLVGLTPGRTYYVAVVAQSAAGTVYGHTLSLVTLPPPTPAPPSTALTQSLVTIPHFNVPFFLNTSGSQSGASVVEQETIDEILADVNVIVECVVGQCPQLPSFGRPDISFAQAPVDTTELVAAIQRWEPRATESVVSQLLADGTTWGITLSTQAPPSGESI